MFNTHALSGWILEQVSFDHGTAKASVSDYDSRGPDRAFDGNSGTYFYTGRSTPFNKFVWFQFQTPIIPGRISIMPHQHGNFEKFGPTKWQFIASNGIEGECSKDSSSWTVLCEDLSGEEFTSLGQRKSCDASDEMTTAFYCLGVKILDSGSRRPAATLSEIKMWKKT